MQKLSTNSILDQYNSTTGSSFEVPDDARLLNRLLTENETSLDHFRSQTSSSVTSLPSDILDRPPVRKLNLFPVCGPEVVKDEEFTSGSTQSTIPCSGRDDCNNDDVIRTCAAGSNDAGVREVRVIKGSLGLGFCVEGGRGSLAGDRPITVKRLFRGILIVCYPQIPSL